MILFVSEYVKPTTLEEAYQQLIKDKTNHIIAGGAWMKLTLKSASHLISLEDLDLNRILTTNDMIEIGSMVTLREIETNEHIKNCCSGILSLACHNIMGINVRNIATIGGSVMGRLAFSDLYPALLVLDATLVFYKAGEVSFADFLKSPKMDTDILLCVRFAKNQGKGYFRKVATTALDFAILNLAIAHSEQGWRISVGATPYVASLATSAMSYLNESKRIDEVVMEQTVQLVLEEIPCTDNIRASKEYREQLIKAYIKRGIKKVIEHVD